MLRTCRRLLSAITATLVLLFATRLAPLAAAELAWKKDFRAAARESARENKLMLVEVTAAWCGYCHKMLETTFTDEEIIAHVNGCFVPVVLDADANQPLVEQLGVEGLPATVIISPEMKVVKKIAGYQTAAQLTSQLADLCRHQPPQPAGRAQVHVEAVSVASPACAFGGFCLVTLLDQRRYVVGSPEFASTYRGREVCFASAEDKQRFEDNPVRYWPVADEQCLVSAKRERARGDGNPRFALIYADRLWLFADAAARAEFYFSPAKYDRQARMLPTQPQ